ncbi:DNA polymerase III subunit delta' [Methylocystis parvus]|uniref:DNA polymerase III subunit delta n=1 Tax=Methylocystis parvus TaxID=134 RepID=A0A6B8M1X4_9HYPH|nr:DNA polymerase III subunit delta' [Methylocystis parvus]QGM98877.1 DNA polymerase III subunit delta' [Methylocystis parvus]WBK00768.1 DNA polymerase III subunit delta' [Methylocystis parvus OBBP]
MSKEAAGPPESDRFDDAPHPRETLAFFGHAGAEHELLDAYKRNRLAQAWIVGGPEGVGKATFAWRFARFLLAHPDPKASEAQRAETLAVPPEHVAARRVATMALADISLLRREWNEKTKKHFTEIRVDDVREITRSFHQGSGTGGWRVAIIDCADDLNRSAANALLKLIEEPPERSLFLLVAHQPGRVLPTIRSRCRKLMLGPLTQDETVAAVGAVGAPWSDRPAADIAAAAARAEGSVRETLRLLGGDAMAFDTSVARLFQSLPRVDWGGVHFLADKLTGRDNEAAYETFMRALERHLDSRVRTLSQGGAAPARMIGYARAWDEIRDLARETDVFNFDKRAMVLGVFERLARAEGAG